MKYFNNEKQVSIALKGAVNVVKYFEHVYVKEEDADYLVYELCRGQTLNDLINDMGKIKELDIKRLFE